MHTPHRLEFGPFCLDLVSSHLLYGGEVVPLRRKTFKVLRYLAERPHELVTSRELYEHVWNGVNVSRGVLRVNIREIRAALGDSAQAPKYLETVRGHGYRFIGQLTGKTPVAWQSTSVDHLAHVVGYRDELTQLQRQWHRSCLGQRQVVMISGEAGMGKSTLVDRFLAHASAETGVRVARGQGIEHEGTDDAHLPLLSALERLARVRGGDEVVNVLRQVVPSWLLHLPMFLTEAERDALPCVQQGTTQAQMLLELSMALERLADASPLVLVLEDLHWSDAATVAALAYLTSCEQPAKLLILGTYRPAEMQLRAHPLIGFLQEAEAHRRVTGCSLSGLTEADIAMYWRNRLRAPCSPEVTVFLKARSGGNALFLTHLIDHLMREALVVHHRATWVFRDQLSAWYALPQEINHFLTKQLAQLPPALQHVLQVASVAGDRFTAAEVAAGAQMKLETIEQLCTTVVGLHSF